MKYNIIQHITTFCNYDCSYCDVIKDWKNVEKNNLLDLIDFVKNNHNSINRFKFFWWEPLLRFDDIKYFIDSTNSYLWNKYEIVTNTTILNDEIWKYFSRYFEIIFFSIDSENFFDFDKVTNFIKKYDLSEKLYFNLVISPWFEKIAKSQFDYLYSKWLKNFNILPVYFTKKWTKQNLLELSNVLKYIVDKSINDREIKLYWFQLNNWYNSSLINESLFIDTSLNIYHSDFVSTFFWDKIKNNLNLWFVNRNFNISNLDFEDKKNFLINYEKKLISSIPGQRELHSIMDYFSKYLNKKSNGI